MIGRTISHYRILEHLGQGGMGVVYVAEDTHLARRVAVKFAANTERDEAFRSRFLREARAASALNHPNIAAIYDYGEADGMPFLVMELVNGMNLHMVLRRSRLNQMRALEIVQKVAEALDEAHHHGIIHRDIKPGNVIIGGRGEVKVLDFGLAKQMKPVARGALAASLPETATNALTVSGTPNYMSPEQAKGEAADPRSDLFSLGVILYECLASASAFQGNNAVEVLGQVLHVDPPNPSSINPSVPPELDRITKKALAKTPEARYQSAAEFIADLSAARHALQRTDSVETVLMTPASVQGTTRRLTAQFRRRYLRPALALVCVLAAALLVWRLWLPSEHTPTPEVLRYYQEGVNALRDGTYFKASLALQRAVTLDPKFALGHARLAEAWMELDYTDKAREEMLRAAPPGVNLRLSTAVRLYLEAINRELTNDYPGAVSIFREIVRGARGPELAGANMDLTRALEMTDNFKEALQRCLDATRANPEYAAAFLHLGLLYTRVQDGGKAARAFDQAESLYRVLANYEGITEVFYERAIAAVRTAQLPEAAARAGQAVEMAHTAGNFNQEIAARLLLSEIHYTLGDSVQGQKDAAEALDLARSRGFESLTTRSLIQLGNVSFARGNLEQAGVYYQQGLEYAQRFGEKRQEMRALFALASLNIQQGKLDEGVRYLEPAAAYFQQNGFHRETSQALILLARVKRRQGDYEAALRASTQQLQLAGQSGDRAMAALAEASLGSVLFDQDRFPEALTHFRAQYGASEAVHNQSGMGYALMNSGIQLNRLGRFQEAQDELSRARAIAEAAGGDKSLLAQIRTELGEAALEQQQYERARSEAQAVLSSANQDRSTVIEAHCVRARSEAAAGRGAGARQEADAAVQLAGNAGSAAALWDARLCAAEVHLESHDGRAAADLAARAQEQFSHAGKLESEWRAWAALARAAALTGDRNRAKEAAARAADALARLAQSWAPADYQSYLSRPDVRRLRMQLAQFS